MFGKIQNYKLSQNDKAKIDLLNEIRGVVFMIQDSEYSVYDKRVQELLFSIKRVFSVRDVNKISRLIDVIKTSEDGFIEASEQLLKMVSRIQENSKTHEVKPSKK
jgi:hypothetical protein